MPALILTTGLKLLSEHVQRAEFYPRGSFTSDALIYAMSAGRYGVQETQEQNFLCIHTTNGKVHVRGTDAEQDATALEQAGVFVYRSPLD